MSVWNRLFNPFAVKPPSPRDRYAGYNERVMAGFIDVCVLFILLNQPFEWLQQAIYGAASPSSLLDNDVKLTVSQAIMHFMQSEAFTLSLLNMSIQLLSLGLMHTAIQHAFGTTLGRFLVGMKLVDATTEMPPTLWQYIRRMLGYFVSLPPFMLGFIWQCFDAKRQTWHDKIAGTVMLDMRPRGWYWAQIKYWFGRAREKIRSQVQETASVDHHQEPSAFSEDAMREPPAGKRDENT